MRFELSPTATMRSEGRAPHHAWRQDIGWRGEDARQLGAQKALPLLHRNATLQQEGPDLIDDAGAL